MDEVFLSHDFEILVGAICISMSGVFLPLLLSDYGIRTQSLCDFMSRSRKLSLDVRPLGDGEYSYSVAGDTVVVDLSSAVLEPALSQWSAKEMIRELSRSGVPEFSIVTTVSAESHSYFIRYQRSGLWLLVLLGRDATELVVESMTGNILRRHVSPPRKICPISQSVTLSRIQCGFLLALRRTTMRMILFMNIHQFPIMSHERNNSTMEELIALEESLRAATEEVAEDIRGGRTTQAVFEDLQGRYFIAKQAREDREAAS